jgi:hypothetical protein
MGGRWRSLLWPAALTLLCAGCGEATTLPATGPPSLRTPPDRVTGQVVSYQDWTVVVSSPDGSDRSFAVSNRTPVTQVVIADPSVLTPGTCVVAGGGSGVSALIAVWMLVEGPEGCSRPGAAIVGRPDAGVTVMAGRVENVVGREVTLVGPTGRSTFAFTVATPVAEVLDVPLSNVIPGRCVIARGRRGRSGELTARHVHIVPTPAGGCFSAGGSGGVAVLGTVEPRPGTGVPGLDVARLTGPGGGGGNAGNGIISGGTIGGGGGGGGGGSTPFPVPREPEGSNLSPPSEPPRPVPSSAPEFVPPPAAQPSEMPTERPGGSTPPSRPGMRQPGQGPGTSPGPGMRGGGVGSSPPAR